MIERLYTQTNCITKIWHSLKSVKWYLNFTYQSWYALYDGSSLDQDQQNLQCILLSTPWIYFLLSVRARATGVIALTVVVWLNERYSRASASFFCISKNWSRAEKCTRSGAPQLLYTSLIDYTRIGARERMSMTPTHVLSQRHNRIHAANIDHIG